MSVTKSDNDDCKLVSRKDVNNEQISFRSSQCSCLNCDSIGCFKKRNKANKTRCQCEVCEDLKNCQSLPNKATDEEIGLDLKNIPSKKIIREVVTRETIESLKRVTETMYEYNNDKHVEIAFEAHGKNVNKKVIPTTSHTMTENNMLKGDDDISRMEKNRKKEICNQINTDKMSTNVASPTKYNHTATKLSAQVMNVPYEDLHKSVPSNQASEHNPLSKLNIFQKIKEIYDACSCKVCECISTKPLPARAEFCNCKPCDCNECASLRKKLELKLTHVPHSGCPCVRCDREDCRGVVKNAFEPQICDCTPCDCIQCSENLSKPCNCERCQCINCTSMNIHPPKTVRLGQVDEINHREMCKCSPCECIECKNIYNRTDPTIMTCTTSTEMAMFRNCRCDNCPIERCQAAEYEPCSCERHNRMMKKTFENNIKDYDIRTIVIDDSNPFNQQTQSIFRKQEAVTLFASLKNHPLQLQNNPNNSRNKDICDCVDCECIVCTVKEKSPKFERDSLLRPNVRLMQKSIKLPMPITNACKCISCECEICSKNDRVRDNTMQSRCNCDICDCLNCENALYPTCSEIGKKITKPLKKSMNVNCNCSPCKCENCNKYHNCSSSVKYYSDGKNVESRSNRRFKKVMLISPSTSELSSQNSNFNSISSITLSPNKSSKSIFQENIPIYDLTSGNVRSLNNEQVFEKKNNRNNVLFNLHSEIQDYTTSLTPVLGESNFNACKEINHNAAYDRKILNTNTKKSSEFKSKSFNIIHETPVKITSEESLPIFWTCRNETLYSNDFSHGHKVNYKICSNNIEKCLNKTKYSTASSFYVGKKNYNEGKDSAQVIPNIKESSNRDNCKEINCDIMPDACDVFTFESNKYNIFNNSAMTAAGKISVIDKLDPATSYEKATSVLLKAKEFSSKLMKMLDSFERANKEFKSASDKFKILHHSLLDINNGEGNTTFLTKISTTNENGTSFEIKIDSNKTCLQNIKNENEAEKEYEQSNCNINKGDERIVQNLASVENYENKTSIENITKEHTTSKNVNTSKIDAKNDSTYTHLENMDSGQHSLKNNSMDLDKKILKNPSKQDSIKEIETMKSKDKAKQSYEKKEFGNNFGNEQDVETFSKQKERASLNILKKNLYLDPIQTKSNKKILGCTTLEFDIKEAIKAINQDVNRDYLTRFVPKANEALANLQSEVNNLSSMLLLQPNQSRNKTVAADSYSMRSTLNLKAKSMSRTASSQTCNRITPRVDKEVYFNGEKNIQDNYHQDNKFDMESRSYSPIRNKTKSRSQMMLEPKENPGSNITMNKSSCDALKVSFVGIRRVSDHTVLVKWSVPKQVNDVQGYELLVDGRAVQKIFSPARNMAVVTCLPHADRVLLAVRTLARDALCTHEPVTSVVYRPRMR